MSPRDWQTRIADILTCCRNVQAFTAGMTYSEFAADPKTIRAVAFELTALGEAAHAVPENIQKRYSQIPWGKMQALRNVLVHEYFRLDEEIIWHTSNEDIPSLTVSLEAILAKNKP